MAAPYAVASNKSQAQANRRVFVEEWACALRRRWGSLRWRAKEPATTSTWKQNRGTAELIDWTHSSVSRKHLETFMLLTWLLLTKLIHYWSFYYIWSCVDLRSYLKATILFLVVQLLFFITSPHRTSYLIIFSCFLCSWSWYKVMLACLWFVRRSLTKY